MRDFLIVLRTIAKQRRRAMVETKSGSKAGRVAMGALVAFAFLVVLVVWTALCAMLTSMYADYGCAELALFFAFLVSMVMTLMFCIASVIGNLFATSDAQLLAALPLKPSAVFFARFVMIYITELLITLFISLPALVCYIVVAGGGVWMALVGTLVIVFLPSIPLALASAVSLLLMRWSAFMRHREKFTTVFSVIFTLVCCFGGQFLGQTMGNAEDAELAAMLGSVADALRSVMNGFPPAKWATLAAAAPDGYLTAAANGLLYLLVCVGALALAGFIGGRTYFKGLSAASETATKKRKERAALNSQNLVAAKPWRAFLRRERICVLRSSVYATNCLIGVVMFPLMIVMIPIITSVQSGVKELLGGAIGVLDIYPMLLDGANRGAVFGGLLGIFMFATFANIAACTAISREGEGLALVKSLPVSYATQCVGKLVFAAVVNVLTMLLMAVAAVVFVRTYWLEVLLAGVAGAVASVASAALGMTVDVLRPKLKWQSEAEAVKQNINAFFGMLLNILLAALVAVPSLLVALNFGVALGFAAALALGAGFTALSVRALCAAANRNLARVNG